MGVENLFPFRCHACAVKFYAFLEDETFAGHLPEQIASQAPGAGRPEGQEAVHCKPRMGARRRTQPSPASARARRISSRLWASCCCFGDEPRGDEER